MTVVQEPESGTRDTILELIVERGPITAASLAKILYLTPAAVRRHIGVLEEDNLIEVHETGPTTKARRGRPARHYVATKDGQLQLTNEYSESPPTRSLLSVSHSETIRLRSLRPNEVTSLSAATARTSTRWARIPQRAQKCS